MPPNGERAKVDAHDVVDAETRTSAGALLEKDNRVVAVRKFADELLASLRLTQNRDPDVQIVGLILTDEGGAAETVRGWVTAVLDEMEARNSVGKIETKKESPEPGAVRGVVTQITAEFACVVAGTQDGDKERRKSYFVSGGIPGARKGLTEVWIVPTGTKGGPKQDARFVCKVGEEPGKNGARATGQHPAAARSGRTGQQPAVRE